LNKQEKKKLNDFYQDLCDTYFEDIYYYCKYLVKGQGWLTEFVEECTQKTFLEARLHTRKLVKHPNVAGWLYITAKNIVNDSFRTLYKQKYHKVLFDDYVTNTLIPTGNITKEFVNLPVNMEKFIVDIIYELSDEDFKLYKNYYRDRVSISQLAEREGISIAAMTTRIYQLKHRIRKISSNYIEKKKVFNLFAEGQK
jgi:RNA polymerase sigma-70 factor (ECF subfamily)